MHQSHLLQGPLTLYSRRELLSWRMRLVMKTLGIRSRTGRVLIWIRIFKHVRMRIVLLLWRHMLIIERTKLAYTNKWTGSLAKLLNMSLVWGWIEAFLTTTGTTHLAASATISAAGTYCLHRRSRRRIGKPRMWPGCLIPVLGLRMLRMLRLLSLHVPAG